jgi:hypothetical protein
VEVTVRNVEVVPRVARPESFGRAETHHVEFVGQFASDGEQVLLVRAAAVREDDRGCGPLAGCFGRDVDVVEREVRL